MDERNIFIHHIGGRGGPAEIDMCKQFKDDVELILYDADEDCCDTTLSMTKKYYGNVHMFPYCFSSEVGSEKLHINYSGFTNSIYQFNEAYGDFYCNDADGVDMAFKDICKLMEVRDLNVTTFDIALSEIKSKIMPPDLLCLDVEGAEYDILLGSEKTLNQNVLAVLTEVVFHPLRKNQHIFTDISELLSQNGFEFIRFLNLSDSYSNYRAPIGARYRGYNLTGDAIFFKSYQSLRSEFMNEKEFVLAIYKQSFIAINFGQLEYALYLFSRLEKEGINLDEYHDLNDKKYIRFINDFIRASKSLKNLPKTYCEQYDYTASKELAAMSESGVLNNTQRIKNSLKKIPVVAPALKLLIACIRWTKKIISRLVRRLISLKNQGYNVVESVFIGYGLKSYARSLRMYRVKKYL